ncbi:hypothetical protein DSO57_1021727 [Entomophthora muscae]|uniref:Uncharacterized protein n=1 Tax=Entomophthora muscae TaxID=34485 RepID=A0ACC2UP67_9FUNG|nr:hypothetical protein DSO57_1021727 [Entomophthora muscae]
MSNLASQNSFKTQWAESLNSYYFRVELPGFVPKDIDIKVEKGEINIKAASESDSYNSKSHNDSSLGAPNPSGVRDESFQADEFLKNEDMSDGKKSPGQSSSPESQFSSRRFQTSFQVPADKVQIQNIHAFMEGERLVVKIPKLRPQDLPSFQVEVHKSKL